MRLLSILLLILLPWLFACVPASSPTTQTDGGTLSAAEQITAEIGAACPSLAPLAAFVPAAPAIGAAILVCEGAAGLAATIEEVLALFGVRAAVAAGPLVPLVFDGRLVGYFPRSHADAAMTPAIAAEIRRRVLVADGGAR